MRGLVRRINQRAGCGLVHLGDTDSGETSGAAYVRWPDGHRSVVTQAMVSAARMRQTADVLEMARDRGLPVPRHELTVELDHGVVAVVQERLPGTRAAHVDAAVIDALVAVNDRFAGLLAQRLDVPVPPVDLPRAGTSDPRYELVNRYSDRSRRLLRRIREPWPCWQSPRWERRAAASSTAGEAAAFTDRLPAPLRGRCACVLSQSKAVPDSGRGCTVLFRRSR